MAAVLQTDTVTIHSSPVSGLLETFPRGRLLPPSKRCRWLHRARWPPRVLVSLRSCAAQPTLQGRESPSPAPQADHLTYRTSPHTLGATATVLPARVRRTKGSRGLALVRAHDKRDDQGATDGAALGARELRGQKARSGPAVLSRRAPRRRRCRTGGGPGAGVRPATAALRLGLALTQDRGATSSSESARNAIQVFLGFQVSLAVQVSSAVSKGDSKPRSPPKSPLPGDPRLQEGKEALAS